MPTSLQQKTHNLNNAAITLTPNESILELKQLCYVLTSLNFELFSLFPSSQKLQFPPHKCRKLPKSSSFHSHC